MTASAVANTNTTQLGANHSVDNTIAMMTTALSSLVIYGAADRRSRFDSGLIAKCAVDHRPTICHSFRHGHGQ
jgi:hypothetical protein